MYYSIIYLWMYRCFLIGKYLLLGEDAQDNWNSIAQFSVKDADAFVKYEVFLGTKMTLFYYYHWFIRFPVFP